MAFTQTQLDALEAALATGQLEVEFEGSRLKYRSTAEMLRLRDVIRKQLGLVGTGQRMYGTFTDGLA
jgi:hypothetical protein